MKSNNRINIKKGTFCKVDGGALLYTLFFILFISVLLYGLLFAFELYQQRQNTIQTKIRLQKHISLLEQISLYADKSQLPLITRQLNDWAPMDSQWIDSYPWGIYDLYSVNAKHQSKSNQSIFLVGHRKELEPTNPSLVIADQQNPLVLAGGTQIEGDILT